MNKNILFQSLLISFQKFLIRDFILQEKYTTQSQSLIALKSKPNFLRKLCKTQNTHSLQYIHQVKNSIVVADRKCQQTNSNNNNNNLQYSIFIEPRWKLGAKVLLLLEVQMGVELRYLGALPPGDQHQEDLQEDHLVRQQEDHQSDSPGSLSQRIRPRTGRFNHSVRKKSQFHVP